MSNPSQSTEPEAFAHRQPESRCIVKSWSDTDDQIPNDEDDMNDDGQPIALPDIRFPVEIYFT